MKQRLKNIGILGSLVYISACSYWPKNGTGGMAENNTSEPYPIEAHSDLTFHHGLRSDFEIQKNKLDFLILNGAKLCFPASVARASDRENRIIRSLTGGLIEDSAIDILNQRDHLAMLDRKLETAVNGGSCRLNPESNEWLEEVNDIINKDNIFAMGSDEINPKYARNLIKSAEILGKHEHYYLHIVGHTDPNGSEPSNEDLSKRRSQKVAMFLIENGISEEKMKTYGYGEYFNLFLGKGRHIDLVNRRVDTVVNNARYQF